MSPLPESAKWLSNSSKAIPTSLSWDVLGQLVWNMFCDDVKRLNSIYYGT